MKTLTHRQYLSLYKNTLNSGVHYLDRFRNDDGSPMPRKGDVDAVDYLHCSIGIITELGELHEALESGDVVNIAEEIGDCFWYMARFEEGLDLVDYFYNNKFKGVIAEISSMADTDTAISALHIEASKLLDLAAKRSTFYGTRPENEKLKERFMAVALPLFSLIELLKLNEAEIRFTNINKLQGPGGRFHKGFTIEEALNRNLESERKILEGK